MGFVNQSLAQLRDLFASMTPAARITSALLLGVIVVSLGYLFRGFRGGADEYLFGGEFLAASEADRAEAAIAQAGLTGYERQGNRIRVPRGEKAAYLAAVADAGALPTNFHTLLDESLDAGLLVDRETRKQRWKAARERQLSMMVSRMQGVEQAQVLYDIREARGWTKEQSTATVSVQPESGGTLDAQRIKMIQKAVAGAIPGMNAENVTILNLGDDSQFGGGAEVLAAAFNDPYFQTKTTYERLLKSNIEDLLRDVKPAPQVQVSAQLDDTLSAEVRSVKADGETATIRETTDDEETVISQAEERGPPGLSAQGPNRTAPEDAVAKNENRTVNGSREAENFVPTTEELLKRSGLVPKEVRAAIAVPSEYLVRVWRETTPDATADAQPDATQLKNVENEVIGKIKTMVAQLFPKKLADDPYERVEVTILQSLSAEPVAAPSAASRGLWWASENSGSLAMGGLALVSLVMLRSMVRSIPTPEPHAPVTAPTLAANTARETPTAARSPAGEASPAGAKEKQRPRLRLKKGPTLKDDLTEMVREDPDGAAAILRTWIGNAG